MIPEIPDPTKEKTQMSVCRFIAADMPLPIFAPAQTYPLHINLDTGTIDDGGADDNYFLTAFPDVKTYTDRSYGVSLEWNYTDGRAEQIIAYIKNALHESASVEFWLVWLMDYCEYEERPYIHRKTVSVQELTTAHIRELDSADIWNKPDRMYPQRLSFYCLTVIR
jgi:hypothetical protein